jgi:hypothetical protein
MRDGRFGMLGGDNKVVEVDETYIGGKAANCKDHVPPKEAAFALVERDGSVRSFHVPKVDAKTLGPVLHAHVDRKSYLMTDDATVYLPIGRQFSGHGAVNHSIEEYVRGGWWHTNTVENYFSILKRGITGTHVSSRVAAALEALPRGVRLSLQRAREPKASMTSNACSQPPRVSSASA